MAVATNGWEIALEWQERWRFHRSLTPMAAICPLSLMEYASSCCNHPKQGPENPVPASVSVLGRDVVGYGPGHSAGGS